MKPEMPAPAEVEPTVNGPGPGDAGHVLRTLVALRSACALYPAGHPAIETQIADLLRFATRLLRGRSQVRLDIIRGVLNCDGEPLHRESQVHGRVLQELIGIGIDSVHLSAGISADEVRAVGSFLANEYYGPGSGEPVIDALQSRGVRHLNLGRVLPVNYRFRERPPEAPDTLHDDDYQFTSDVTRDAFEALERGLTPDIRAVRDMLDVLVGRVARSSLALHQVMALKSYENRSYLHSVNVALLAVRLGERLGMDRDGLVALAEAALFHDVGKTRIPVEILTKPGRPTEREWRTIRRHPLIGAEILSEFEGLMPLTPVAALEHHVDYAGGGYPELDGGRRPHALSQIVSVVDVYESVTGARTYRDPATPDQACLILARMAGEKLNPALVKAFVSVVTFFPIGTVVRTTRGELGVVVETHEDDALHPTILLVEPAARNVDTGARCDLRERDDRGGFRRDVLETMSPDAFGIDVASILRRAESA